jgi:sulfite reductase (NADPH) flavoprotein alpha-component
MPDNASLFWESLNSSSMPRLSDMKFGVLGLGDTGYDEFCQAGKLIDTRLEQLGAQRLVDRLDCDVDYEDIASDWINKIIPLTNDGKSKPTVVTDEKLANVKSIWNRKNPYPATLRVNKLLSGEQSLKEIRHFEIDLGDSGITYDTGDALNIMPINDDELVKSILLRLELPSELVLDGESKTLADLLKYNYEISTPSLIKPCVI